MADLDFTVRADTSQAQRNLQQLEKNVGGVSAVFAKLGGAIAGLAIGAAVTRLFSLGNQLADLSATTNVSIQTIAGLGEALARNSGSFDQSGTAVLKFTETLGAAFEGSDKTRESFARVGVTLEDLRTLSEQDLLRKTILGLGQVTDTGTRAALSADLFAKSLRGADLAGVARDLDQITAGQAAFASSAATAGAVNQSLQNSFRKVQEQLLVALEPLAKLAQSITANEKAIADFIEMIIALGKALAALFIASRVLGLLGQISNAASKSTGAFSALLRAVGLTSVWKSAAAGIRTLKIEKIELFNIFRKVSGGAEAQAGVFKKLLSGVGGLFAGFTRLVPLLGVAFAAFKLIEFGLKRIFDFDIVDYFDRAGKAVANFFGIEFRTAKEKEKLDQEAQARQREQAAEQTANANRQLAESDRAKKAAEERAKEEQRINESYKSQLQNLRDSITAYGRGNDAAQKRLQQEIQLIGLTDDEKTTKQSLFDLEDNHLRELTRLQDLYNEKSASGKREDMRLLPDIVKAMDQLTVSYQQQVTDVQALTEQKLKALNADKQRLEIEQQVNNLAVFGSKSRIDAERQLRDIQSDIAKSTMTEIEKKYHDIARAAEESAKSQIQSENARRAGMNLGPMSSTEEQAFYDAAVANVKRLQAAEKQRFDNNRTFNTGFKQAFNDYVTAAGDAASKAANLFKRATQGMEDAIVNFAKTGKFEFKGFVASLAEELLRSQIRELIAGLGSGQRQGGGSTILGTLGNLLGFANGGVIPTNGPVIVGERGPEILTGAAGRNVISNEQAFGNSSVTYNINAVDAMSFKQMVAADPTFLFAVTEQGRRRLPGARA